MYVCVYIYVCNMCVLDSLPGCYRQGVEQVDPRLCRDCLPRLYGEDLQLGIPEMSAGEEVQALVIYLYSVCPPMAPITALLVVVG